MNLGRFFKQKLAIEQLIKSQEEMKLLQAKSYIQGTHRNIQSKNIHDYEFKVFSQWGDDGIIQYLIREAKISSRTFVEFGVENYDESNTRFLLINDNWSGLVMDCSEKNMEELRVSDLYWHYDLQSKTAFINKENINELLRSSGFSDLGILHIYIDGNDYWIWDAIDLNSVKPTIVILEYNSVFGCERSISIPYQENFNRFQAHHSGLYFGASLKAFAQLSQKKGYSFVGCNSAGNNAYFVKNESLGSIPIMTVEEGYVESKFRESRDAKGDLSFMRGKERFSLLKGLPVFDFDKNAMTQL